MTPTISVVTPAFNASATISETIRSVQGQTFIDWEMLIVDDGSTDNTASVVRDFASSDARIRLIQLPSKAKRAPAERILCGLLPGPRRGSPQGEARNVALRLAKGRFLAFIDADDLWLPQKLERQLAFTIGHGAMMTYCQYRRFRSDPNCPGPVIRMPSVLTYDSLCGNTAIGGPLTIMIDTSLSGPVEFPNQPHEDLCLWLRLLRNGQIARGFREDLARYRVSPTSVSGNKLRSAIEVLYVFRVIEELSVIKCTWYGLLYAVGSLIRRFGPRLH